MILFWWNFRRRTFFLWQLKMEFQLCRISYLSTWFSVMSHSNVGGSVAAPANRSAYRQHICKQHSNAQKPNSNGVFLSRLILFVFKLLSTSSIWCWMCWFFTSLQFRSEKFSKRFITWCPIKKMHTVNKILFKNWSKDRWIQLKMNLKIIRCVLI